jgi:hypothetical protein
MEFWFPIQGWINEVFLGVYIIKLGTGYSYMHYEAISQ